MGEPVSVPVVAAFFREVSVGLPPGLKLQPPRDHWVLVSHGRELSGQPEQASAGIGAGIQRQMAANIHLNVEQTPLCSGCGPDTVHRGRDPGTTITDHDRGGGEAFQ